MERGEIAVDARESEVGTLAAYERQHGVDHSVGALSVYADNPRSPRHEGVDTGFAYQCPVGQYVDVQGHAFQVGGKDAVVGKP